MANKEKEGKEKEKRNLKRKTFTYYMQVVNDDTDQLVGYLADINLIGFRLDCKQGLPLNQNYSLRFDLTNEVADKGFMVVVARSKWSQPDQLDPFVYNIGFQLISIESEDTAIYKRMIEKYGFPPD